MIWPRIWKRGLREYRAGFVDEHSFFAPATVANVGPGFDIFGLALEGIGDTVTARKVDEKGVFIRRITGDGGRLPMDPEQNTVSISAMSFLKRNAITDSGIELDLHKGMPINSGLGSSGASAVAGAFAALSLYGDGTVKDQILPDCVNAEGAVAGFHADNVAASLFGGIVIIKSYDPLEVVKLPSPSSLFVVVVTPDYEVSTRHARGILPNDIPLRSMVKNFGNVASLVSGILRSDLQLIGRSIEDHVVEPLRGVLIPGFGDVKKAALEAGAFGCGISGSGPTVFAFSDSLDNGKSVAKAMLGAFSKNGLDSRNLVSRVNSRGAQII